jgi:hypothetical protein
MAYHEVLTPSQRQPLIDILETLTEHQIVHYFTLSASDMQFIRQQIGEENQLGMGVQLCFLRYPGHAFEETDHVPDAILVHIARQIGVPSRTLQRYAYPRQQTRNDHLTTLQKHFGFQPLSDQARQALAAWLVPLATQTDDGLTLIPPCRTKCASDRRSNPGFLLWKNWFGKFATRRIKPSIRT